MENLKNRLANIILYAFVILFLWIIANGLLSYDKILFTYNPIILALGIALYFILLIFVRRCVIPKISRFKAAPFILLSVFTLLCLTVGITMRVNPSWDMGEVFYIAKAYAEGSPAETYYLYYFPNNVMITLIYIVVFKIALFLGITDFVIAATVFNSLLISGTAVFLYLTARELYGKELSLLLLIITLCATPLYLQAAIYYTDSASMFFVSLTLYLIFKTIRAKSRGTSAFLQVLLGTAVFISFKIKITSFIMIIAIVLYALYSCTGRKKHLKNVLKKTILSALTFILLFTSFQITCNAVFDSELSERYKYPPEHWIMMGLNGIGGFSLDDCVYTSSFPTYEERQTADRQMIKTRLGWYDTNSFIKHLTEKLKFAWTDGTYFAPEKLRREPVCKNLLHDFVLADGKYNSYYKYFPQIMHFTMLILIIVSAYSMAKSKKKKPIEAAFVLAVFGIALFLLLWENRSRYILTLLPVMMLLQLSGFEVLLKQYKERKKNHA